VRRLALIAAALVALGACSSDDSGSSTDASGPATTSTTTPDGEDHERRLAQEDLPVRFFRQLPPLEVQLSESAQRPAMTAWHGGAILLGEAGGLIRFDDGNAAYVETTGLDHVDGSTYRTVESVAASGDTLIAVGREVQIDDRGIEVVRRAAVWRSTDSVHWELLDDRGLDGDRPMRVRGVTVDPVNGRFVAYGEVLEEHEARIVVWRSTDGEQWDPLRTPGLDRAGDAGGTEHLDGLVVVDDRFIGTLVTTPGGGLAIMEIVFAARGRDWSHVNAEGLQELDFGANDVVPPLAVIDGEATLFANTAVDFHEPNGEREVTLFHTTHGETWSQVGLGEPYLPNPYYAQAITGTDDGFLGLTEGTDEITIWRSE
jgi:hypothetical protein